MCAGWFAAWCYCLLLIVAGYVVVCCVLLKYTQLLRIQYNVTLMVLLLLFVFDAVVAYVVGCWLVLRLFVRGVFVCMFYVTE